MTANYSPEEIKKAHEVLYNEGLKMRYQVAGKEYVDRSLKAADTPFSKPMQEFVAEACWGWVWSRPGLELKTRSFLNLAMLCALNRGTELGTHVKGALNNGATEEEIREVILHATAYCGMPAGIEGFRVAAKAIEEWKAGRQQRAAAHDVHAGDKHSDIGLADRVGSEEV